MRLLATLLLFSLCVSGQNISSGLSGTVHDPAGAVIAAAQIAITNQGQGFIRREATNAEGFFSFPDLSPGIYDLGISAAGFGSYRQTDITLNSGEQRNAGIIRLKVGAITDSVTVNADAVSLNTVSGEKAASMGAEELSSLALRGRDVFDAVSLMAGVVDTSDGRDAPGPTSIGNIYIAGGRNDQKNMTVDGVTNLDTGSNGSVHSMPSMDSVQELKVLSSNYGAEYGRNSGGTITVITKGGGKQFHGSESWYYRHEDLNANDFFNNLAGRQRTPYRYNINGYTVNGPVVLPKLSAMRDKMFFFWSQEFQHQRVAYGTKTITVPTGRERNGDFSQSFDVNAKLIPVQDPLNGKVQFSGNTIPSSRVTKIGQNILNIFPMPNYTDPNPSRLYQWNYFTAEAGGYNRRTEILRFDYQVNSRLQTYLRLSNNADRQHAPYGLWVNGSLNFNLTPIIFEQPGRGASIHLTWTVSPTIFNETIIGASQNTLTYTPEDLQKVDRTALGINIPQRNPSLNPLNLIPNITFGGIANPANPSLSDGTPYFNRNTIYSFVDNVSRIWHTHTLKVGTYLELTRKVQSASSAVRGTIRFDRDTLNPLDANNAYANALLGNYDTYAEANGRPRGDYHFRNAEFFVQDTWKVNSRLSLDVGLRMYNDPPQYDAKHQLASFSPSLFSAANAPVLLRPALDARRVKVAIDPTTGKTYPQALIGSFAPGIGSPSNGMYIGGKDGYPEGLYSLPALAFAPRFGFAYTLTPRTVIRGGGGVFFDRLQGNPTMDTINNPPTIYTPTQYYGSISDIQTQLASGLLAPSGTVYSLGSTGKIPTTYNYSMSVQRMIRRSSVAEVSYVGNVSRHQIWRRNINPVPLGANFAALHPEFRDPTNTANALPANFERPYQGYGDIFLYEFAGTSSYNSLQASYSERLGKAVTLGASYTFSKVLDQADGYGSAVDPFYRPRAWNYGPAGFDRSQVFSARYTWNLPLVPKSVGFRPLHLLTDGWQMSGITHFQSGAPITPGYSLAAGIDYTGSASASTRPTVRDPSAPAESRFAPPIYVANAPTLGNVGKGVLRGPGTNNWDISMYKTVNLTERLKGELRAESYNTFNHTQYSGVDGSVKFQDRNSTTNINSLFLQPTSARPSRRIQLAVRVWF
jgi:hypothetical protein